MRSEQDDDIKDDLGSVALKSGAMGLGAVALSLGTVIVTVALDDKAFMSGGELVAAFAILGVVLVMFVAFLLGRQLKMRAVRGDDSIEIETGDEAR